MQEALPEPMTPPECDLRDFQFMPIEVVRLFNSEFHARATDAEWRAAVTLWLKSWHQMPAGSLPDDDIALCRLAELGRDHKAWKRLKRMALYGWSRCTDGRLYHATVAEKVNEAWSRRQNDHSMKAKWREKKARQRGSVSQDVPRDTPQMSPGTKSNVSGDVPRENALKGQGEGKDRDREKESKQPSSLPAARPDPGPPADPAALRKVEFKQARQRVEELLNSPSCVNLNRIDAWITAGADLETDILPTLNRLKSKWNGGTLKYFDNAVMQAMADRTTPPEPGQNRAQNPGEPAARSDPDAQWRGRLTVLAAGGVWPRDIWGPAPGEPGCNVPSHLIEAAA